MNLGFVLIRMLRHTNMEMTVTEEDIYRHRSLETGSRTTGRAPRGAPGPVRRQREWGQVHKRVYLTGRRERSNAEQA